MARLLQGQGRGSSDGFRFSFSLLPHEYNGLLKVTVPYVNSCSAGRAAPSSEALGFLGDPGRHVASGVAAWKLPCS